VALSLAELMARHARPGRLDWIGVRPDRHATVRVLRQVDAVAGFGLTGDRAALRSSGRRQVTLLQSEHLIVIASLLGVATVPEAALRRNLVVSGINLLALRDRRFYVGDVLFQGSGICAPCSRMESALGHGAYTAMRGHGGITARVLSSGRLSLHDPILPESGLGPT
jgi:MOSC domain-containing protein YiiM